MARRSACVQPDCARSGGVVVLTRQRSAGQGITIVKPLDEVAVAAAHRAERGVLDTPRLAANRTFAGGSRGRSRGHGASA